MRRWMPLVVVACWAAVVILLLFPWRWTPQPGLNRANYDRIERRGMMRAEVASLLGSPPAGSERAWYTKDYWKLGVVTICVTTDESGLVVDKTSDWDREPGPLRRFVDGVQDKWNEWFS